MQTCMDTQWAKIHKKVKFGEVALFASEGKKSMDGAAPQKNPLPNLVFLVVIVQLLLLTLVSLTIEQFLMHPFSMPASIRLALVSIIK